MNERNPSQIDWARLAAYIDGEGSVLINARNGRGDSNWGSYVRVVVSNTDPRLHVWLREMFGGTIAAQRRNYVNPRHSTAMKWHVSCRQARWILEGCLPYLIIKKQHAEIALAYQARLKGPGHRRSSEELQIRATLRENLSALNRKNRPLGETRDETISQAVN